MTCRRFCLNCASGLLDNNSLRISLPMIEENSVGRDELLDRISITSNVCFGKPCIKGAYLGFDDSRLSGL
jgi:hypothetical protein